MDLNLDYFFLEPSQLASDIKGDAVLSQLDLGKKIRAQIIIEISKILKISNEHALNLSRIIELIHNATLTHDDIIDKAKMRRGLDSIPEHYGNSKAVLMGDHMLSKALTELCDMGNLQLVSEMGHALKSLVDGEWQQLECVDPFNFVLQEYITLARNKTGALFSWAFAAPMIFSQTNISQINLMKEIGNLFGVYFQIQDDILDFSEESKKEQYIDFKNNNPNFVFSLIDKTKKPKNISELNDHLESKLTEANNYLDNVEMEIHLNSKKLESEKIQIFIEKAISKIKKRNH